MPLTQIEFSQKDYKPEMHETMNNLKVIEHALVEQYVIDERRYICFVYGLPERFFYGLN